MWDKVLQFLGMVAIQDPKYLILYAIVYGAFLFAIIQMIRYEQDHEKFAQLRARWKANAAEQERLREEEYKRQLEAEGEFKDKDKLRKVTRKIQDAGLKAKFPELTAPMFVAIMFFCSVITTVFVWIWTKSFIMGILAAILACAAIRIWLEIRITKNYIAIEREVVKFINILENMSYSEGNIAEMLGSTVPYLSDPLKSSIEKCYYEIKATGDTPTALQHLVDRTNYKKLKETFNALRVCSIHNEDYESIIAESRESIRTYITFRKANTRIKMQSLIDMVIMGVMGIVIVAILGSMVDNVQELLFQSLIGQVLLTAVVGLFVYGIWTVLKTNE